MGFPDIEDIVTTIAHRNNLSAAREQVFLDEWILKHGKKLSDKVFSKIK